MRFFSVMQLNHYFHVLCLISLQWRKGDRFGERKNSSRVVGYVYGNRWKPLEFR